MKACAELAARLELVWEAVRTAGLGAGPRMPEPGCPSQGAHPGVLVGWSRVISLLIASGWSQELPGA